MQRPLLGSFIAHFAHLTLRSSVAAALLIPSIAGAQTTLQIGCGTATSPSLPISSCWNFTYSQQIYTQAQIAQAGGISMLRFLYQSGPNTNSRNWTVYVGHTTKTSFTSVTDWEPVTNLTQVFSGNVTYPAAGNWLEVPFSQPFQYNNVDNLIIAVDENSSGLNCTIQWGSFTSGDNTGMFVRFDGTNPNPSNPGTANGRVADIPQVQLEICSFALSVTPAAPSICPGTGGVLLTADEGSGHVWSPATGLSATTGASVTADPTTTTTYTVQGADGACSGSATVVVTVGSLPPVPNVTRNVDTLFASGPGPFQWALAGVDIPGATNDFLVVTVNGSYSVRVTNAAGCSSTASFIMTAASIEELSATGIRVFPNPAADVLTVQLDGMPDRQGRIVLLDAAGRTVLQEGLVSTSGTINVGQVPHGYYVLQVFHHGQRTTVPVLVGQ